MIGPIDPRAYDCEGRITLLPEKRSLHFKPTAAMGTYMSGDLMTRCKSIAEIREFLRRCRYVSDPEQFGVRDSWTHPCDFEVTRQGDCDCFALWAWRQLVEMGYEARFVIGNVGYGRWFHAWVTFRENGDDYLLEATAARRKRLSRLATMFYEPIASVSWSGSRCVYHQHEPRDYRPTARESLLIAAEWVPLFLFRNVTYWLMAPWRFLRKLWPP